MKKTFPLSAVLMLTTGRTLTGFDKMHELAEHVAGHPIWTHEFAEKALWDRLKEQVFEQHPALREALEIQLSKEAIARGEADLILHEYLQENAVRFGPEFVFERGNQERAESPLASMQRIAPDKPVIGIVVDDE